MPKTFGEPKAYRSPTAKLDIFVHDIMQTWVIGGGGGGGGEGINIKKGWGGMIWK